MDKKEYIDRASALEIIKRTSGDYAAAFSEILQLPAAEVAPVVRCKGCGRRGTEDCAMYYECECGEQHTWENDNDFCSWGVRKEEGGTHGE